MLQYNCNRCGCEMSKTTFEEGLTSTVSFSESARLIGQEDMHLCPRCTRHFEYWVRGEFVPNDNPSEFKF